MSNLLQENKLIMCSNPKAQYFAHQDEITKSISRVLEKGHYILGEELEAFENEFAQYIGARYGIGVGSGTEALHIALRACGIGLGDEVITVAHTAVATVAAIEMCGAMPVFVDIDPEYFTINPEKIEDAITLSTKAIIVVHLYGQPVDLNPILEVAKREKLIIVEDCAQAHGAIYCDKRVGSWGDVSCFSFYPTKNLGAIGDGGMIVTSDEGIAKKAKLLREYGWAERYVSHISGYNSRLDEIQAAILRAKLRYLDKDNERRIFLATEYLKSLKGLDLIPPLNRKESSQVFHLFVIRSCRRDELHIFLKQRGIYTLIHYPVPIHLQPAYLNRYKGSDNLLETERAAKEVLSLPIYPELSLNDLNIVVDAIKSFFK